MPTKAWFWHAASLFSFYTLTLCRHCLLALHPTLGNYASLNSMVSICIYIRLPFHVLGYLYLSLPSTCQIVYDIEVDTLTFELRLSAYTIEKATMLVNRLAKRRMVTLRDLQMVIGF